MASGLHLPDSFNSEDAVEWKPCAVRQKSFQMTPALARVPKGLVLGKRLGSRRS